MRSHMKTLATTALCLALSGAAFAEAADDSLDVETEAGAINIVTQAAGAGHLDGALPSVFSGWLFRDEDTRVMQKDDFDNPGMVYADFGLDKWNEAIGKNGESCAGCHSGPESMKGLRATTPRVNADGKLQIMEELINGCVTERMGLEAWGLTSDNMKNMLALIALQSRGEIVNIAIDGAAAPFFEKGKEIYYTRFGQLEMSCANCHEDNYGNYIRADHLSQGQISGFPVYRLKDAALVTAQQRFVGCVRDTRAETFKAGSDEFKALELYVASRGNGLGVEGVGVRP